MQINKIAVLVVLYNKKIKDSATVKSVLEIGNKQNLSLTIVNNGPEKIDDFLDFKNKNPDFNSIEFREFLENKSLSKIYNNFINDNSDTDYYIIFDDDTIFKPDLITSLAESSSDMLLPLIISQSDQQIYYPTVSGKTISSEGIIEVSGLMSISSGLAISNHFANLMSKEYGQVFDEHFALYGIDTSFFIRTQRYSTVLNSVTITCQGSILHSLSRTENKPLNGFRLKERLYDAALIARHYPSIKRNFYLFKKLLQNLYRCNFSNVSLLIKCYVTGKHPRS